MVARGIRYVTERKTSGALATSPVFINMSLGGPELDAAPRRPRSRTPSTTASSSSPASPLFVSVCWGADATGQGLITAPRALALTQ